MTTLTFSHPVCEQHIAGRSHPERPERLAAIRDALSDPQFDDLVRREAPLAPLAAVDLAHAPGYGAFVIDNIPSEGRAAFDADTVVSPASGEAALRGVGAAMAAVDAVMAGEAANAFCAIRPPGHHAEKGRPMGFCLFNNVAIAAHHARKAHGLSRVAVMDFDVHHGNGTQDIFWDEPELFYASTHQAPFYPGTGAREERGAHRNIANAPLPAGAGSSAFRRAMNEEILPALRDFAPEFLIISAGFDAHRADPLAMLELEEADFAWATEELLTVARDTAQGRLISALEGGYDLQALGRSAAAHVAALMTA